VPSEYLGAYPRMDIIIGIIKDEINAIECDDEKTVK
jgi:hypothetical protein